MSSSLIIIILTLHLSSISAISDLQILLNLKKALVSPAYGRGLEDWTTYNRNVSDFNASRLHCNFTGVTCNNALRVVALNLSGVPLCGTLPPDIGELSNLESLCLFNANLTGQLPVEMSFLVSLKYLNMSINMFSGVFPGEVLRNMHELEILDVCNNNFSGPLPIEASMLKKIKYLELGGNYFSGEIPKSYSEMTNLNYLSLVTNCLSGRIPATLGRLRELRVLHLGMNTYSGGIPAELGKLRSLELLTIPYGNLRGRIPKSFGNLKRLKTLLLHTNELSGELPSEWSQMVSLTTLGLSRNKLTGEIPESFSGLTSLTYLSLSWNNFYGKIPSHIGELPSLEKLQLWNNNFTFELPENLGRNGRLITLDITSNRITGTIPRDLCKGGKLEMLILTDNALFGQIPEELGSCRSLARVRVGFNQLSGKVPAGMFSLPDMNMTELNDNQFSGDIPAMISGGKLIVLSLANNQFTGVIPPGIGELKSLEKLYLQNNYFTGEIPPELFELEVLGLVDMSGNRFRGTIPISIGHCKSLIQLDLSRNNLAGLIPETLSELNLIGTVNLSSNSLTGDIPEDFGSIQSLASLDLSYNNLYGRIPANILFRFKPESFAGNPNLCYPDRPLPCPVSNPPGHRKLLKLTAGLTALVLAVVVAAALIFYWRKRREGSTKWKTVNFQRLNFNVVDVLESIKEENVIGRGSAGVVYRGTMPDGTDVAIKKLANRPGIHGDHGFGAELATLGSIRHRYIVRLLGYVSNKDTNLLVYEFMPNGSLGEKLHSPEGTHLHWERRCKIAVEAAQGLSYLHHSCTPKIFHRDIKSNNILLNSDYEARISDFGLAKFLQDDPASEAMSAVAGTYGYIAPEYAYTLQVDEKSDVYSFGVVMLELITGRKPFGEFGEGVDIVRWIRTQTETSQQTDEACVLAILDSRLSHYQLSSVIKMFKIAMRCVEDERTNRPNMREVVHMLTDLPHR